MDAARSTGQIVSQFLHKLLQSVFAARIPRLLVHGGVAARHGRRDRWFHLVLGDAPSAVDDHFPLPVLDPLVVDIILSPCDDPAAPDHVVERWIAHCVPLPSGVAPTSPDADSFVVKKAYKRSIVLLRAIYSTLRLLPAYRVFRTLCSSNQSFNYELSYRVSSFAEPFSREEEAEMKTLTFAPAETQLGQLTVSVQYRTQLESFNLEISSLLPPMLITDYMGSPAAQPMRAFAPSSAPAFLRQHSWTRSSSSSSTPILVPRHELRRMASQVPTSSIPGHGGIARKGGFSYDELRLSPPSSVSLTPSPPALGGHFPSRLLRGEKTAPVSIPQSAGAGRGQQVFKSHNFSEPSRAVLPPVSPRKTLMGFGLSHELLPDGGQSFKKSEGVRTVDLLVHLHSTQQKGSKDGRDDSGRFSGALSSGGSPRFGFSRSSSRLSIQDDFDDADFSYPFAVDDVDTPDSQTRSNDGKESAELGPVGSSSQKSQDAAVGVLVHLLRTAAPLREQSYSSSQSSPSELPEAGPPSSLSMLRKTSDALRELQSYKEMKNFLLSQSSKDKLQQPPKES